MYISLRAGRNLAKKVLQLFEPKVGHFRKKSVQENSLVHSPTVRTSRILPVVIKKECLLEFVDLVFAELDPASAAGRTMTRSGHFDTTKPTR